MINLKKNLNNRLKRIGQKRRKKTNCGPDIGKVGGEPAPYHSYPLLVILGKNVACYVLASATHDPGLCRNHGYLPTVGLADPCFTTLQHEQGV